MFFLAVKRKSIINFFLISFQTWIFFYENLEIGLTETEHKEIPKNAL